jgi:hypothetical protein
LGLIETNGSPSRLFAFLFRGHGTHGFYCFFSFLVSARAYPCTRNFEEVVSTVLRSQPSETVTNLSIPSFQKPRQQLQVVASRTPRLAFCALRALMRTIANRYETPKNDGNEKLAEIARFSNGQGRAGAATTITGGRHGAAADQSGVADRGGVPINGTSISVVTIFGRRLRNGGYVCSYPNG